MSGATFMLICIPLATVLLVGLLVARALDQAQRDARRSTITLTLPRKLALEKSAFVQRTQHAVAGRRGLLGRTTFVNEVVAAGRAITFRLRVPASRVREITAQLRTAMPGARVELLEETETPHYQAAIELRLVRRGLNDLDATDPGAVITGILTSLSGLTRGSHAIIQTLALGRGQRTRDPRTSWQRLIGEPAPAGASKTEEVLGFVVRIAAAADTQRQAAAIVSRIERAIAALNRPGATLRRAPLPTSWVARRIERGTTPLGGPGVWILEDVAPVMALWPVDERSFVPGLKLGGSPQLPVDPVLPRRGRIIGRSDADGLHVAAPRVGASRHSLVLGPTGSGKSWATTGQFLLDTAAGYGGMAIFIKPQNTDNLLSRMDESCIGRTVIFDPLDTERPVPQLLLSPGQGRVEGFGEHGVLDFLNADAGSTGIGPRSSELVAETLAALRPGESFLSMFRAWNDTAYRAELAARVADNPIHASFWSWFNGLSDEARSVVVSAPSNKARPILASPAARNYLAAPRATITLDEIMRNNLIAIYTFDEGRLGRFLTTRLGRLTINQLWDAIQYRTNRKFFGTLIDEAPRFVAAGVDLEGILARAREFQVGVSLVGQSISQFGRDLAEVALNSCVTKLVFSTSSGDAHRLAAEFGFGVEPEHLMSLEPFHAVAKVALAGAVSTPFTVATEPLPPEIPGRAKAIRAASRERWGVPRAEIEASFDWGTAETTSATLNVGRRRS